MGPVAYLDEIKRHVGLGTKTVQVAPGRGEARKVVGARIDVLHLEDEGNVVLLGRGEARAAHGRGLETSHQLSVQVDGVLVVLDGVSQTQDERDGGLVDRMAVLDGDALGAAPRHLLEGGDDAVIRPLGAVPREGRLHVLSVSKISLSSAGNYPADSD